MGNAFGRLDHEDDSAGRTKEGSVELQRKLMITRILRAATEIKR